MPQQNPENAAHKTDCGSAQHLFTERNRYFTGKYMTARDFGGEQDYFLSHHHWHQWTLHGWGIVWGLQVKLEGHCLTMEPGMALDCHGRELVLPYAVHIPIGELGDQNDLLVGLQFETAKRDPVPLLLDDRDECHPPAKDTHNRTEEFARITWQPYCAVCWSYPPAWLPADLPQPVRLPPLSLDEHNHRDECGCSSPPVKMQSQCECGPCGFVPLVRIKQDANGVWHSSDRNRRYVHSPFYGEALTHIVGINWNHGAKTGFQQLLNDFKMPVDSVGIQQFAEKALAKCQGHVGRIIIEFDRPLGLESIEQQGAAAFSTYLAQLLKLEYVELDDCHGDHDLDGDDPPTPLVPKLFHLSKCRHKLYCDFPAHRVNHDLPVRMRLTLNCDMVIDQRGRAVDGDHLGGHVPNIYPDGEDKHHQRARSGNGVEGGVFYSWTELTPSQK